MGVKTRERRAPKKPATPAALSPPERAGALVRELDADAVGSCGEPFECPPVQRHRPRRRAQSAGGAIRSERKQHHHGGVRPLNSTSADRYKKLQVRRHFQLTGSFKSWYCRSS